MRIKKEIWDNPEKARGAARVAAGMALWVHVMTFLVLLFLWEYSIIRYTIYMLLLAGMISAYIVLLSAEV